MKKIICILIVLFSSLVFSQSETGEDELYKKYEKVDKELNATYNKLKKQLTEIDKNNLIASQKAWINFRDLNCKFISKEDSEGGVISNKLKIDCLIQLTLERTNQLKELFEEF